jgi:hypothetical protein
MDVGECLAQGSFSWRTRGERIWDGIVGSGGYAHFVVSASLRDVQSTDGDDERSAECLLLITYSHKLGCLRYAVSMSRNANSTILLKQNIHNEAD